MKGFIVRNCEIKVIVVVFVYDLVKGFFGGQYLSFVREVGFFLGFVDISGLG